MNGDVRRMFDLKKMDLAISLFGQTNENKLVEVKIMNRSLSSANPSLSVSKSECVRNRIVSKSKSTLIFNVLKNGVDHYVEKLCKNINKKYHIDAGKNYHLKEFYK